MTDHRALAAPSRPEQPPQPRPASFLALGLGLALVAGGCAAGPAPDEPEPAPAVEAAGEASPAPAAVAAEPAAALVSAEPPPALLDDGDPASLATAVGRSLEWLRELPPDSLLAFGVREVPVSRLRASLEALRSFLAGDPDPEALAAWVRDRFDVVESVGGEAGDVLFTGYYEPVIPGARERTPRATVPVYGHPDDLVRMRLPAFDPDLPDRTLTGRVTDGRVVPYYTRREIQEERVLADRGLELAWVEDRIDLFFVEVQGSGAIRFPDGGELGISYAASNGRPYRSIGRLLIDEGLVPAERMSMQAIRDYLARHPDEVSRVLNHNPSYVFFRPRDTPPIGALGVPVTPERSIATDLRLFPRGAPAFIATTRPALDDEGNVVAGPPLRRFVLNQDTGGAIRGPGRVDVFWGRGGEAAETAGRMQQRGRLFFLVPRPDAFAGPAAADPVGQAGATDPLRVVVLSDLNSSYGSTSYEPEVARVIERVTTEWRPELVLLAGDVVAGQKPALSDDTVRAMWAAFDSVVAGPLRRAGIPFAFTPGNHDASGHPAHGRDRRLAASYWSDVDPGIRVLEGGRFPFHYAFVHGDVFFLVLDASTGGVVADTAQMAWIRRVLGSRAARSAGLRVALGHVPLYAVAEGRDRPGEVQAEPDSLRALLEAGGVKLFVSGHHHAYYPGRRGDLALLHAGALGQGARRLLGSPPSAEPYRTVTRLEIFPGADSVAERTYRLAGNGLTPVDPASLPPRIDGPTGPVFRSDGLTGPVSDGLTGSGSRRGRDPASGSGGSVDAGLTVVSYNIHAGRDAEGRSNLERVAALIDSVAADVVLLQEVDRGTARSGGVDQLAELRRLTGMHGVFGRSLFYDGGEYGIAVLSRWPILESRVAPLPAEPPEARAGPSYEPRVALLVRVDAPGGPIPVINTHLGAGAAGTYRRQELVALLAEVHRSTGRTGPLLVGGDLNATPESDLVGAATLPLDDAFARCGTGDGVTYPARAPDRRIDYVLLRGLECTRASVAGSTASDHRPLVVRFRTPR